MLSLSPWGEMSVELRVVEFLFFTQCRLELMRWMWMGLWKMTWVKAEKGLEQMTKLFRGECLGFWVSYF